MGVEPELVITEVGYGKNCTSRWYPKEDGKCEACRKQEPPKGSGVGLLDTAAGDGSPRLVDLVLLRVETLVGHVDLEEVEPHPYRSRYDEVYGFPSRSHCAEENLRKFGGPGQI